MGMNLPRSNWSVASETGVLTDVLLCRPTYYRWIPINAKAKATLQVGRPYDAKVVEAQFNELVDAFRIAGTTCHFLEADENLPYQIYTRDSSQMTPWGVAMMLMQRNERHGEYAAILDFYGSAGVPICFKTTAGSLEGGDIHIIRPGLAVIGYSGVRTDLAGASQFAKFLRGQGWEVRLEYFPEHYLHFDVLFCMVADGLAVACESVLEDEFIAWLRSHGIRTIDVTYKETMKLGCNLVSCGDGKVISQADNKVVNAAMRAEGLTVLDPELDMIYAGGGSVHCITMALNRKGV